MTQLPSPGSSLFLPSIGVHVTDILPEEELITVSIPLDSNVVTQPPLRTEITLSTALEFDQFYGVICDAMEIPQSHPNLGYRFSWEPRRTVSRMKTDKIRETQL